MTDSGEKISKTLQKVMYSDKDLIILRNMYVKYENYGTHC